MSFSCDSFDKGSLNGRFRFYTIYGFHLSGYKSVQSRYEPIINIIDARWDNQLNRPLHVAGYFLNPRMQYSLDFKGDIPSLKLNLYMCIEKMCGSRELADEIDCQLDMFKNKKEHLFNLSTTRHNIDKKTPVDWNTIELPTRNNVAPLRSDTIRGIHLYMGGSYYPIPCSILSIGKDRKTPQRYLDVPTISWRIFILSISRTYSKKSLIMASIVGSKSKSFMIMSPFILSARLTAQPAANSAIRTLTNLGKSLRTSLSTTMKAGMKQNNSSNRSRPLLHLKASRKGPTGGFLSSKTRLTSYKKGHDQHPHQAQHTLVTSVI
nr:hypothetical protein [Tanacetum cinerariifolium]